MPRGLTRDRLAVLAALVVPLVVCAVLALVRDSLPNADAALILVLVVVAIAANGHRVAGILAAFSAAIWFDFFLTRPYERFSISSAADIRTTLLLLAVAVAVTELAVWGRRKAALASNQAGYLAGIRAATEVAATGGSASQLVDSVRAELVRLLGLRACHFEYGAAGVGQPARLRHDGEVEWHHQVWDVDHKGLPVESDIELIVESGGRLRGRFMMSALPNATPSHDQRLVAVTLANQVGAAFG